MAQKLLIIGESGTGKTCSIRTCDPKTTAIISPEKEALSFNKKVQKYPGKYEMLLNATDARKACKFMKEQAAAGKKLIVVDDFQYFLAIPYMNRIKEIGWDKYNDFGSNYFEIIEICKELPDDVVVAYMSHGETLDNGLFTVKLIGKLLREKITIEGLFTVVLRTGVSEAKYYFYTQNSGKDTTKSPMGMFPAYAIENDLEYVADKIRNYYEVGEYKTDEEIAQADAAVAADIEKPTGGKRVRGSAAKTTTKETPPTAAEPKTEPTEPVTPDEASTGRRARGSRKPSDKTHDEVVAENQQKIAEYMDKCDEAVDAVADGAEEVDFDKACEATANIPQPDLQTPPRRTRKERVAKASEPVQDGTTNTDSESVTLEEDAYFHTLADDNYIKKHKGDTVELVVDGVTVMEAISKEEFGEGIKKIAQAGNPTGEAMNPPVEEAEGTRTRRTRRTRS